MPRPSDAMDCVSEQPASDSATLQGMVQHVATLRGKVWNGATLQGTVRHHEPDTDIAQDMSPSLTPIWAQQGETCLSNSILPRLTGPFCLSVCFEYEIYATLHRLLAIQFVDI